MKRAIFWIVVILALAFNGVALFDFFMSQANPAEHLAGYPPAFVEMVTNMPSWRRILLVTTIFIGIIGALLLALRRSLAERALWGASAFLLAGLIADMAVLNGIEAYGLFGAMPFVVECGFALYASWAARQGLLR